MATRKITVSVPEEMADQLDQLGNKSAFVTKAVERELYRAAARRLREQGLTQSWVSLQADARRTRGLGA